MAPQVTITKHFFFIFFWMWVFSFQSFCYTNKNKCVQMSGDYLMNLQLGFENELSLLYDHNSKHFKTLVAPLHFSKLNTVSNIWRFSLGITTTVCWLKIALHLWKRNYFWPRDLFTWVWRFIIDCNTDVILWEWQQLVAQFLLPCTKPW